MKKGLCLAVVLLVIAIPLAGCFSSPQAYQGAGIGAGGGALAGALLDRRNPWRGGVIGALIGGTVTGTAVELSNQAARQAAEANRPVQYESEDRAQRIEAHPLPPRGYGSQCRDVVTKYYERGELVREETRNECR